jgi:predicted nuclease of predicted toxin-antitoxin system
MKLLIDMNLSPNWVNTLAEGGWTAIHWQSIGDPRAKDVVIMSWARSNGYIIFTNDLDFGTLLAITRAQGPSVIQARTQDVMPQTLGKRILQILDEHGEVLQKGALITVDETKSRVRILPFS